MKIKYSKGVIDDLARPDSGQKIYWFEEVSGYGIRLTPTARSLIFEKRVEGVKRRVLVGKLPSDFKPAFLTEMKTKALEIAAEFARGNDPVEVARKQREAKAQEAAEKARQDASLITLRTAFQRYADADKQKGSGKGTAKKPRTKRDIEKTANTHFADWLDKAVTSITGEMVTARYKTIVAKADAARLKLGQAATGKSAQAELAMRYLRATMNYVNDSSDDDEPIVRAKIIRRVGSAVPSAPRRKTRHIPDVRIPEWVEAVKTGFDGREYGAVYRDALMFMLLTGARLAEVMGNDEDGYPPLRWNDVDFTNRTVTFRNTKNRSNHTMPMGAKLLDMMKARQATSKTDVVFSDEAGRVPATLRGGYDRIKDLTGVYATPHDLRRTFATVAGRLDISEFKLKRLLNHTKGKDELSGDDNASIENADTTSGYVHVSTDDLREPMQKIEDHMLRTIVAEQAA